MERVVVRFESSVLGHRRGQTAALELTPQVQTHIDKGYLTPLPVVAADPAGTTTTETVSPPGADPATTGDHDGVDQGDEAGEKPKGATSK